jgi:hypothetical protein
MASIIIPAVPSESRAGRFGVYGGRYVPETLMVSGPTEVVPLLQSGNYLRFSDLPRNFRRRSTAVFRIIRGIEYSTTERVLDVCRE